MKPPYPNDELFAVCDPDGHIMHTTVTPDTQQSIDEFLSVEQSMQWVVNLNREAHGKRPACASSWEGFEAQGYRVIPVSIVPR